MSIQLENRAVGQHGANIYFKEFTVSASSEVKTYKLGAFYFVRKSLEYPVAIAEFQLIWKNTKDGKTYASVKLYFNPNDINPDVHKFEGIGKDEVLEADQHTVIECIKFPQWECHSSLWYKNLGGLAYNGIPQEFYQDGTGVVILNINGKKGTDVKILSYPQYCRYKTCLRMLRAGIKMTGKMLLSQGGLAVSNTNTVVLFSRWRFKKDDIHTFSLTADIQVPVFKGRPRKKKNQPNVNLSDEKMDLFMQQEKEEGSSNDRNWTVPVTRIAVSADTSTIQLKRVSHKKNGSVTSELQLKSLVPLDYSKNSHSTDAQEFNAELNEFMTKRATPILKIPSVGYAKVDLYRLYTLVASHGGYGQVTLRKQWRAVYDCLGHCSSITNAATCTRKAYEKLLLPFERHLRNRKQTERKQKTKSINEVARKLTEKEVVNMISKNVQAGNDGSKLIPPLQEGDAFRLMIQKRRGRPSKEFREKIERLKSMKQKVEVEIYPPLSKHSKLPAWLNSLNVDIVNPRRKRELSSSPENEQSVPTKKTLYDVSVRSDYPSEKGDNVVLNGTTPPEGNVQSSGRFVKEESQIETISSIDYNEVHVTPRVTDSYNMVSPHDDSRVVRNSSIPLEPTVVSESTLAHQTVQHNLCEFEIKSVRSLAPGHMQPQSANVSHYINFHDNSPTHTITVPHSVLSYRDFPSLKQSPTKHLHYQNSYTFRDAKFSAQRFRHSEVPVQSLRSFIGGENYERRKTSTSDAKSFGHRRQQYASSRSQNRRYRQRDETCRYPNNRYIDQKQICSEPRRVYQGYSDPPSEYGYSVVYAPQPAYQKEQRTRGIEHGAISCHMEHKGHGANRHSIMSVNGKNDRLAYNPARTTDDFNLTSHARRVNRGETSEHFRVIKPETLFS